MSKQTTCKICNKSVISLGNHTRMAHNITSKEYYDIFIKEPTEGVCKMCNNSTSYKGINIGYRKYCSALCSNKDKELQRIKTQNYMDTITNNPDINTKRNKTLSAMWQNNPDLVKQRVAALQQTLRNNPNIIKERERKRKIQEQLNPQINIDRGKQISIAVRNFYNERSKSDSTLTYHLYLVQHKERAIVKIGITHNLKKRLYEIKRIFGSSKCLHTIEGPYNLITKLETYLLNHFNNYCEVQPELGGGRTEWFNSSITNEVINLMVLDHPS